MQNTTKANKNSHSYILASNYQIRIQIPDYELLHHQIPGTSSNSIYHQILII